MNGFERKPPLVYVVCAPRKYQIYSDELIKIMQRVSEMYPNAVLFTLNSRSFDKAMKVGLSVENIFEHVHRRPFRSVQKLWIAGSGSSVYVREVIRLALSVDYGIPVCNEAPDESCLSRYIRMLQLGQVKAERKAERRKLVLFSR